MEKGFAFISPIVGIGIDLNSTPNSDPSWMAPATYNRLIRDNAQVFFPS